MLKNGVKNNKGKILLLDDEEIVHLTLRRILEDEGYLIDSTYTGNETLAKIQNKYDLLISDVRLQGLDGIEVLRQIRKNQIDIEVLLLTGFATLDSATYALNYGARGYLMKPIEDIEEFKNKVHEAVYLSKLRRENKETFEAIQGGGLNALKDHDLIKLLPSLNGSNMDIVQQLLQMVHDAIVVVDKERKITFSNLNFAQLMATPYQSLTGTQFESYISQNEQENIKKILNNICNISFPVNIETELKTAFNSLISVIMNCIPINKDGEYHGVALIISDITEVKKIRQKVVLLATLIEDSNFEMMFILENDGTINICNALARKTFEYNLNEILSLNFNSLIKTNNDKYFEKILNIVKKDSHWRDSCIAVSKNGIEIPVEVVISKISQNSNEAGFMSCNMKILEKQNIV